MFLKRYFPPLLILFQALLIVSCSQYEKLLKSSDVGLKYTKALEYYNKGDYSRASTLFEQIKPYYKGTMKGDTVDFFFAQSYYKQDDYVMAGHYFKEFTSLHPRSDFCEEADFLHAYCYYLTSPRPSLDQQNTYDAITAFQVFISKHPQSKRVKESLQLVSELKEKLVDKSYLSAKLYYNLGYYKASIIALRNSLNEYPDTKFREEMMFMILKSKFLLAENSVLEKQKERYQDAVDEYYSFIGEFPKSSFLKEVQNIYEKCAKVLHL